MIKSRTVAVFGAGPIGISFAIRFALHGWEVKLHDIDAERLLSAPAEAASAAASLEIAHLWTGDIATLVSRICLEPDRDRAISGCELLLECASERLEVKQELFNWADRAASPHTLLCSASSALAASKFADHLPGRGRCLVAHPVNPPHLIPLIEIVPAPFTTPAAVARAQALFEGVGMQPVLVRREVTGFVFNRLQGAMLREAYCLVRDGVVDATEIDLLVRDGLGLRWSIAGPFETAELNTRGGLQEHALRMGPAYLTMGHERGQDDPWTPELVAKVIHQRGGPISEEARKERSSWREREVARLVHLRSEPSA